MGQLLSIIRSKYIVDAKGYNCIKGKPFTSSEILKEIKKDHWSLCLYPERISNETLNNL